MRNNTRFSRGVSLGAAIAMAVAGIAGGMPNEVAAKTVEGDTGFRPLMLASMRPDAEIKEEARSRFVEGQRLYEGMNFTEALEKFEQAFQTAIELENDDSRRKVTHNLRPYLAKTHVKIFEIEQDPSHLRTAIAQLEEFLRDMEELSGDLEDELNAEKILAEAREELEAFEASDRRSRKAGPSSNVDRGEKKSPLWIGGVASLAGGVASLAMMGAGMGIGAGAKQALRDADNGDDVEAAQSRGQTGNALSVTGAVLGSVLITTGVVLFVADKKRSNKVALVPTGTLGYAGIQLTGRF